MERESSSTRQVAADTAAPLPDKTAVLLAALEEFFEAETKRVSLLAAYEEYLRAQNARDAAHSRLHSAVADYGFSSYRSDVARLLIRLYPFIEARLEAKHAAR